MQSVVMCDLDGTIFFSERGFAPGIMETFQSLKGAGIMPTINTARHVRTGRALAATLGIQAPYACLTGGVIIQPPVWMEGDLELPSVPSGKEILQLFRMSREVIVKIFQLAESFGLGGRVFYEHDVCLYGRQELYVKWPIDTVYETLEQVQDGALQMFITGYDHAQGDMLEDSLRHMSNHCSYYIFHHRDGFEIAVNPTGVSKAKLVDYFNHTYHIPIENIMAIGDSPGDAPMIKKAGIGVATALAPDEVKAVADVVLDIPSLDAVPLFLLKHFGL